MKNQKIELIWESGLQFNTLVNGHKVILDADPSVGGSDHGPRPKILLLVALAGCTAMDVISILGKMKVNPKAFSVEVEAEQSEEHPKVYTRFHIKYCFDGDHLDREKIDKAIHLSQEKYCAVSAMFRQFAHISHEVMLSQV